MAQIHELITEIEHDLELLIKKADQIQPAIFRGDQKRTLFDLQKGLRGIQGWNLGEVKNAFGIGVMTEISKKAKGKNE